VALHLSVIEKAIDFLGEFQVLGASNLFIQLLLSLVRMRSAVRIRPAAPDYPYPIGMRIFCFYHIKINALIPDSAGDEGILYRKL